jgi:hypothetical protein
MSKLKRLSEDHKRYGIRGILFPKIDHTIFIGLVGPISALVKSLLAKKEPKP